MITCFIVGIVVTVLASDNYPFNYRFTLSVGIIPLFADSLEHLFILFVHRVFNMNFTCTVNVPTRLHISNFMRNYGYIEQLKLI
jgi:hypothetical protein